MDLIRDQVFDKLGGALSKDIDIPASVAQQAHGIFFQDFAEMSRHNRRAVNNCVTKLVSLLGVRR